MLDGTLSRIASGNSANVIERAADVMLKEGRPLVLVPREAPLSRIHLENSSARTTPAAAIVPASPGFYARPESIDDLVDQVVTKTLDRLGLRLDLIPRWKTPRKPVTRARGLAALAAILGDIHVEQTLFSLPFRRAVRTSRPVRRRGGPLDVDRRRARGGARVRDGDEPLRRRVHRRRQPADGTARGAGGTRVAARDGGVRRRDARRCSSSPRGG